MKVAIIFSNSVSISKDTKKGTEIFDYILANNLTKHHQAKLFDITAFASGDSDLPLRIESIDHYASSADKSITAADKHIIFELALISKAFSMQDQFGLYHINIGDGDIALPFLPFVKKPILITLHYTHELEYVKKYFSLFKNFNNVFFISISNAQRNFFPDLNYAGTIYHGIETSRFRFASEGGEDIMWAGRGIPDKGLYTVFKILRKVKRKARLFAILKEEYSKWLKEQVLSLHNAQTDFSIEFDKDRFDLAEHYRQSKLFLFPVHWEEPFGLVLIESMSCGTPIVAFARGSIPEIIKDGETGFIVNPSKKDIRGNWIIKKTGIEGLREAIETIYSMSKKKYHKMRQNCRARVEKYFTAERMADEYLKAYDKLMT